MNLPGLILYIHTREYNLQSKNITKSCKVTTFMDLEDIMLSTINQSHTEGQILYSAL
jgi:hypothetical protein